ncbi:MAG: D-aminoacyl-tRNA deacylase [Candidatus Omnitrophota bacterium]
MLVLIQRVKKAEVIVANESVAHIDKGLLLFVGVCKDDSSKDAVCLAKKIANLRIFSDAQEKMNLNIHQTGGEILSVSQFTLYANTQHGNRPGFDAAACGESANKLWETLNQELETNSLVVKKGVFAADMDVQLINNGPVTILLDSKKK